MSLDKNSNLTPIPCKVQYQFAKNINSISRGSSKFHRVVSFNNDLTWLDFYHSPASLSFSEPFSKVKAGNLYQPKLGLKYPGEDDDTLSEIENLTGQGLIIKITWGNGKEKIIGDLNNPVKIHNDYDSDSSATAYTIYIDHQSSHRSFWLEN